MTLRVIIRGTRQVGPEGQYVDVVRTVDVPVPDDKAERIIWLKDHIGGEISGVEFLGEVDK